MTDYETHDCAFYRTGELRHDDGHTWVVTACVCSAEVLFEAASEDLAERELAYA